MADELTLLPPNATTLERAAASPTTRVDALPVPFRELWDPAHCPVALLPWLAFAFGVDDWDAQWTEAQKRAVIEAAIPVKQHRGTIGAVTDVIGAVGITARVQEWFNQVPAAEPYTFKLLLEIDQTGYSAEQLAQLSVLVQRAKNLRSHLTSVEPTATSRGPLSIGAVASTGTNTLVTDGSPKYSDGSSAVDLLIDAAVNGEANTIGALDALDNLLRVAMPANQWADA